MYTKGLEEIKDYKALYTNRALAYLHLGKFQQAIKDCEQVLEYCECFEDGYEKSRDACFKACLRKAVAQKEIKKFQQANESVKEARVLMPKNEEARKLEEEIQFILKHEKAAQELKEAEKLQKQQQEEEQKKDNEQEQNTKEKNQEAESKNSESKQNKKYSSYKEQANAFLKQDSLTKDEITNLQECFKVTPEAKIYFYENKGVDKFISLIKKNIDCYSLMNEFFDNNIYYQTEFAKAQGLIILLQRICENLDKCKNNKQIYDEIEEILELLVTFSLQEQLREWFKNDTKFFLPVLEKASAHLLINLNNEPNVLSSYFSFLGNIVYGGQQSSVTKFIHEHKVLFFTTIRNILSIFKAKYQFHLLKKHTLTFLSNLLTNKQIRQDISQETEILGYLIYNLTKLNIDNKDLLWIQPAESLLGVFSNLTFEAETDLITKLQKFKLGPKVQTFLVEILKLYEKSIEKISIIVSRGMQVIVRVQLQKEELNLNFVEWLFKCFDNEFVTCGISGAAIKVFIRLISDTKFFISQQEYKEKFKIMTKKLHQFIIGEKLDEALFCNTCSFLKLIVQEFPSLILDQKAIVKALIEICKDKLGKIRKNAAILLATLAKNSQEMLDFVRELHGMEVLQNVSQFIIDGKS